MSSNKVLVIDSKDRISSSASSSDFTVYLTPAIERPRTIRLLGCIIPNTIYNVSSTCNVIQFDEGGSTLSGTVTSGSYDSSTILSAVTTAMNAVGTQTYTATYSATTFTITITASSGTFRIHSGSTYSFSNSILPLLGFISTSSTGSTQTSSGAINLAGNKYLYVEITGMDVSVGFKSSNSVDFGTYVVPVQSSPNGQINYMFENTQYKQISQSNSNITQIYVRLKSAGNTVVNLNSSDWCMFLGITY